MPDHAPQTRASLPTTAVLMVGTLLIMLAFIASYVGALHAPRAQDLPVAVVGSSQVADAVAQADPSLSVRTYPSAQAARQAVLDRKVYAALVPDAGATSDVLYVASAANPAVSDQLVAQTRAVETQRSRTIQVRDIAPLPSSDPRGLASFYLVVGWVVGGYLTATVLGLRRGMRPLRARAALLRTGALLLFSAAGGAGSVAYLDQVQHIVAGPELRLMALGALTIAASALSAAAVMSVLGIFGTGLVIVAYVVIGNPSSGGPFPYELLPKFWRTVGPYLPPGAGTDATRNTLYFNGNALTRPVAVLSAYAVAGIVILLISSLIGSARRYARMQRIDTAVAGVVADEEVSVPPDDEGSSSTSDAPRNTFFDHADQQDATRRIRSPAEGSTKDEDSTWHEHARRVPDRGSADRDEQ